MLPSWTWSSTPVTVTVRATFQFAAVNVRLGAETGPPAGLLLAAGITTFAGGWLSPRTVNGAAAPLSVVTGPAVGATEHPAVSSSRFVTATSAAFRPL